jgi:hypothetical protein
VNQRRNYGFERRLKAGARQLRQEAKRQRKASRAQTGAAGPEIGAAQESGPSPESWEWFSPSRGRTVTARSGTRPPNDPPDDWVLLTDVVSPDGKERDTARNDAEAGEDRGP